jgi:hypothetical protein
VLGPRPPPGEKWIFIKIYRFLMILGPSIEPEKRSLKSASTANPPRKVKFIAFLLKFVLKMVLIVRDPIFNISCLSCIFGIVFQTFLISIFIHERRSSFSVWASAVLPVSFGLCFVLWFKNSNLKQTYRRPPKRGNTGAVAGNLSRPEPRWV